MKIQNNEFDPEEETIVMQQRLTQSHPYKGVTVHENYISQVALSSQKSNQDNITFGSEPSGPEKKVDDVKSVKDHAFSGNQEPQSDNLLVSQYVTKSDHPQIIYDHYLDARKPTATQNDDAKAQLPQDNEEEQSWQIAPFQQLLGGDPSFRRQQRSRGYTEVQAPKISEKFGQQICQNGPLNDQRFKIHQKSFGDLNHPQTIPQQEEDKSPSSKAGHSKGATKGSDGNQLQCEGQFAFIQSLKDQIGTDQQKDNVAHQKTSQYATATGTSSDNATMVSGSKKPRAWTAEFSVIESSSGLQKKVEYREKTSRERGVESRSLSPKEQKNQTNNIPFIGRLDRINSENDQVLAGLAQQPQKGPSPFDLQKIMSGIKTTRLPQDGNCKTERNGTPSDMMMHPDLSAPREGHPCIRTNSTKALISGRPQISEAQAQPKMPSSGFQTTRLQILNKDGHLVDFDHCSSPIKGPAKRHSSNMAIGASPGEIAGSRTELTPLNEHSSGSQSQSFEIEKSSQASKSHSSIFLDKDNQENELVQKKTSSDVESDSDSNFIIQSSCASDALPEPSGSKIFTDFAEVASQQSEDVDTDSMIEQGGDIATLIQMVQEYNQSAQQHSPDQLQTEAENKAAVDARRRELKDFLNITDSIARAFGQVSDLQASIPEEETKVGAPGDERVDFGKQSLAQSMWDKYEANTRLDKEPRAGLNQTPQDADLKHTILKDKQHDLAESAMVTEEELLQSNMRVLGREYITKAIQEEEEEDSTKVAVMGRHAIQCEEEKVIVSPQEFKEALAISENEDTLLPPHESLVPKTYTQQADLAQSQQVDEAMVIGKDLLTKSEMSDSCSFKSFSQNIGEPDEGEGESTVLSLGNQDVEKVVVLEQE